ncbi:MAG: hypothetical protein BWY05_00986 [Euryarchaeota archaeon ADurb.Bin165]|nr:MAG: hypothetical protein BWY05_00986 [Euryarchaeota archaeon ADurb.Bin165]
MVIHGVLQDDAVISWLEVAKADVIEQVHLEGVVAEDRNLCIDILVISDLLFAEDPHIDLLSDIISFAGVWESTCFSGEHYLVKRGPAASFRTAFNRFCDDFRLKDYVKAWFLKHERP